jgi:hypothetical protein
MKKTLLLGVTAAVAVVAVLTIPPPARLIHATIRGSSRWICADYMQQRGFRGRISAAARKLLATYIEMGIARHVAGTVGGSRAVDDDVQRIGAALKAVRRILLVQTQVPHPPRSWPVLVSGLAWCDQANGAACDVLSHSFPRAELFALNDPVRNISPHTIGRVWSSQRNEWLYFDGFFDSGVVFRKRGNGEPERLFVTPDVDVSRGSAPAGTYSLSGIVLNEYRPSYPQYLWWKVMDAIRRRSAASLVAVMPAVNEKKVDQQTFERVADQYLEARLEHLFGSPESAARKYDEVANNRSARLDDRAAELASAARVFATTLRTTTSWTEQKSRGLSAAARLGSRAFVN